ncbi:MAG: hypothetical protein KJZ77_17345 [Anaerolineales bacterium]|nr:hypothetical protein [Anaerolineales bacterium]
MNDDQRKWIENELEDELEKGREQRAKHIKEVIAKELTPQGDLLPPWKRFPQIQAGSIGWRMGYGEIYMMSWDKWSDQFNKEQLVEYFKKYLPLPLDWLTWISNRFGDEDIAHEFFTGGSDFKTIHWLEQQGLANFDEFKSWYDSWYDTWQKQKDKSE